MTEQARRREARLRAAVRAHRRFIEMLAHDVRSPVSAALLRSQALSLKADDGTRAVLAAMEDMLQDLSRSVGTLVDGMRILSSRRRLDRIPVDARDAVSHAAESVRRRAERRQLQLAHEVHVEPLMLPADPDRLDTLVMWMAVVCVRLTRSRGRVILGLDADAEHVVFRTESLDSLAGADAVMLARRQFLHGRTAEGADVAIGFGAAVASRLATLHGGRFDAEDDGQAPGHIRLTLLARLPLVAARRETTAKPATQRRSENERSS